MLENLTVRFVLVGFLFWGIMIATGAIWANEAWGRYWSWDPIETWSLIVWIIYAVYLHVRFTLKWHGRAPRVVRDHRDAASALRSDRNPDRVPHAHAGSSAESSHSMALGCDLHLQ